MKDRCYYDMSCMKDKYIYFMFFIKDIFGRKYTDIYFNNQMFG